MNPSDHEQNLRAFEDNSWQLQIPDYPPLPLPLDLIADYRDVILGGFAQWVWGGSSIEIPKDGDGQPERALASNRDELLNKYATVAEWLDREGLFPPGEEAPIAYAEYFTRDFLRNAMNYFLSNIQPPDRAIDAFHLPMVQQQLDQMAAAVLFKYGKFQTQAAFEQYRDMGAQAAVTENELERQAEMNSTACMIMVSAALNQHFADYLNRPVAANEWPELKGRLVQYFDTAPLLVIDAFYAADDYPPLQLDEGDWEKYFTTLEEVYHLHKDQLHDDPFLWSRFFHLEEIKAIQEIGYYRFDRDIVPFVENLSGVIAEIERNIPVEKDGEITAVSFQGKTFLSLPVDHYGKDVVFNRDEAGDSSRRCFYACLIEWVMAYGECLARIDLPLERDAKGNPAKVQIKHYQVQNDQGQLSMRLVREEIRYPEGE